MSNVSNMQNMQNCEMTIAVPPLPAQTVVAMAYVPFQQFGTTYSAEKGFNQGTIFPDLDKPFTGKRGVLK
ncbi:spore coat associated protein CotJA [Clostridium minihomine]|uniref:spore coat associated protein CotJA n=1 Tax=Clostridium minihomine TaxID=2045012 RepID=UPI001FB3A349|nr:spore coat associated protein CotJA [Clostridium minihomine]